MDGHQVPGQLVNRIAEASTVFVASILSAPSNSSSNYSPTWTDEKIRCDGKNTFVFNRKMETMSSQLSDIL